MCGLFMHLSPVPLPAEITSTRTHMCMYVCSLYFLSDQLHSVSCTRETSTTLPSGVSRCWLLFFFCLLAFDLIKRRSLPAFEPRSPIFSTLRRDTGEQLGVRCLAQGHLSRGIEGGERVLYIHFPHLQSLLDWDSNSQPFDYEYDSLPLGHDFQMSMQMRTLVVLVIRAISALF